MFTNNNASPLEHLAAFAIVFISAVAGTVILEKYIAKVRRDASVTAATGSTIASTDVRNA